jgi:type I restriction enzyme, S subunit
MSTLAAQFKESLPQPHVPWPMVTVGDVFEIQQGKALSAAARTASDRYPFLRTTNVLWNRIDVSSIDTMGMTAQERARLALLPGDLLVCEGGEIGRAAVWQGEVAGCAFQNHIHRLRARREADPQFFAFWFRYAFTMTNLYQGAGTKTTIANLSIGRLSALAVPLPHINEQRRIARILSTIQRAKAISSDVYAALKTVRQSLFRVLFQGMDWPVVRLGDVMTLQRGHDLPTQTRESGEVPVISSSGTTGFHSVAKAQGPGVVIGRYGTLGQVHYVDGPYWPLNTTLYVKDFRGNEPRFVRFFLETLAYEDHNDKTSVPGINRNDIHGLFVQWPPVVDQLRIANVLEAMDRRIDAEVGASACIERVFESAAAILFGVPA